MSIVIPVYNGINYLREAIDSALAQTYNNTEVIVVNDGSNDNGATERIALEYGDRIRYFAKPNGGVSSALNYGIRMMKGEYFSWLSHDDIYTPQKVMDSVEQIKNAYMMGEKCVAYTDGCFISKDGKQIRRFTRHFSPGKVYSGFDIVNDMVHRGTVNGCCLLIPKDAFYEFGMFDESLRYAQDVLMWYRIFLGGYSLVSDGKSNVKSRLHSEQVSRTRRDLFEHDVDVITEEIAPLLYEMDKTGRMLYFYTKRLARNNCCRAIEFLKYYAAELHAFSLSMMLKLSWFTIVGQIRFYIVRLIKMLFFR